MQQVLLLVQLMQPFLISVSLLGLAPCTRLPLLLCLVLLLRLSMLLLPALLLLLLLHGQSRLLPLLPDDAAIGQHLEGPHLACCSSDACTCCQPPCQPGAVQQGRLQACQRQQHIACCSSAIAVGCSAGSLGSIAQL
jgi:hypothetical protein